MCIAKVKAPQMLADLKAWLQANDLQLYMTGQ
jgi:hypothetical protein